MVARLPTIVSVCALVLSCSAPSLCTGADSTELTSHEHIDGTRLGIVLGVSGALVAASHIQSYNSFWKGERTGFHFNEDGRGYLGMDKVGHFYFAYLVSDVEGRSLMWTGMKTSKALFYGACFATAVQLYVEIEDGCTPSLGFSVGDLLADVAGSAFPLLQYHVPGCAPLRLKWSAIKSDRYKRGEFRAIIDDYESQFYWLSYPLYRLLPEATRKYVPSFLAVALGYGVKRLDGHGGGEREVYLALDYDMESLPGDGDVLQTVKHLLNFLHLPSPMIRLSPSVIAYGFRW